MNRIKLKHVCIIILVLFLAGHLKAQNENSPNSIDRTTWISDNGNGTYSNPIFYEEFSDPDIIRVGNDYYLTGTTMHTMPGLPVLHSVDLVNWELLTYAFDKLDLGPEYRLENNKDIYGQGIWAPCIRYHNGMFYIFSNVNGQTTQLFMAANPKGPWIRKSMKVSLHDLSVLFDDDGTAYVVWNYDEVKIAKLTSDLTDIVPGTEKVIIKKGSGAGEGHHLYKINGKYIIICANFDPVGYQVCLRADNPYGPYELNLVNAEESLGVSTSYRIWNLKGGPPFKIEPPSKNYAGCISMHQGGIVQTQTGEWWGFSLMDFNSIGRTTSLVPVTWKNGWPYYGLEGNLTRAPRIWIKPNTGYSSKPMAPFERNDEFNGQALKNCWQWNHVPVDSKWSLAERPGYLRLRSMPAPSFLHAKNTLTQRGIGPESFAIIKVDVSNLKVGDIAGLGLLNIPYAWIGIVRDMNGTKLKFYNQQENKLIDVEFNGHEIWLRAFCNFDVDSAKLSYSLDGNSFTDIGDGIVLPFQLKTFQGVRYSLFNFNVNGKEGGYADFDYFHVTEPRAKGLTKPIPYNKIITFISEVDGSVLANWRNFLRSVSPNSVNAKNNASSFRVLDRGNGRIALQSVSTGGYLTVEEEGVMGQVRFEESDKGESSTFQWEDMLKGDIMLMSLHNHKYICINPEAKNFASALAPGAAPDRKEGACFYWKIVD
jgi:xylan 1,4-beta-xylosidase